jgi:ribosomal subunit interface protein
MRLTLKATDIEISADIHEYLRKKLATLRKFLALEDPSVLVAVELGRSTKHHQSGAIFYAEITVYRGKEVWRAVANDHSLSAAIDAMHDEIVREVKQSRGREISFVRRGGLAAKELLRYGSEGLGYVGRPAKAGWRYLRRVLRRRT